MIHLRNVLYPYFQARRTFHISSRVYILFCTHHHVLAIQTCWPLPPQKVLELLKDLDLFVLVVKFTYSLVRQKFFLTFLVSLLGIPAGTIAGTTNFDSQK